MFRRPVCPHSRQRRRQASGAPRPRRRGFRCSIETDPNPAAPSHPLESTPPGLRTFASLLARSGPRLPPFAPLRYPIFSTVMSSFTHLLPPVSRCTPVVTCYHLAHPLPHRPPGSKPRPICSFPRAPSPPNPSRSLQPTACLLSKPEPNSSPLSYHASPHILTPHPPATAPSLQRHARDPSSGRLFTA